MAAYLSQRGKQLQASAICINHVLNTAVDKHTKAIYKTERRKCFLHLYARNRQSLKLLRCLSIHDALQSSLARGPARPGAARPGPARPHACTAELNTEIGCFLTAFLFNHRKEALSDAKQVGPLIKLFTVIL